MLEADLLRIFSIYDNQNGVALRITSIVSDDLLSCGVKIESNQDTEQGGTPFQIFDAKEFDALIEKLNDARVIFFK